MFSRDQIIDKMNNYRTQSLFLETTNVSHYDPIMTLKEVDWEHKGKVLPSLRRIYMEEADPTEYNVAMRVFGSWEHWKKLCENVKISKYLDKYREELEIKLRSDAIKSMVVTATCEGSKGVTAAKYIAEKGWEKRKAGAPSREEKKRELKVQTKITDEVKEDLERLGIELH